MYFRSMRKTAGDVSLSDCIETGKDGNALSLMDVVVPDGRHDALADLQDTAGPSVLASPVWCASA